MPNYKNCLTEATPPPWFSAFTTRQEAFNTTFHGYLTEQLEASEKKISVLENRVASLESELSKKSIAKSSENVKKATEQLKASEKRVSILENRVAGVESELSKKSITSSCNNRHDGDRDVPIQAKVILPEDSCEILLSGFPSQMKQSPEKIINRLLTLASLTCAITHILSIRDWKPMSYKGSSRAFAIKFSSPLVRNEVLKRISSMKNLNSQAIFGTRDRCKIAISNILPKSTYLLFIKARHLHKSLEFLPPTVRNNIVYMRKTCNSTLIPIFSERDLMYLNQSPQPSDLLNCNELVN